MNEFYSVRKVTCYRVPREEFYSVPKGVHFTVCQRGNFYSEKNGGKLKF